MSGAITFKIMLEPGVLPEEFPQTRERRTRKTLALGTGLLEAVRAADVAAEAEPQPLGEQPTEALPVSVAEVFAKELDDGAGGRHLSGYGGRRGHQGRDHLRRSHRLDAGDYGEFCEHSAWSPQCNISHL